MASRGKVPVKKETRLVIKNQTKTPKLTQKAAQDMQKLEKCLELRNVQKPSNWPTDVTYNVRGILQLPDGWHHGKKVTKPSQRGSGGKLHPCFVGPLKPNGQRRIFFHRRDLEKFLGTKIEQPDRIERVRIMNPDHLVKYPDDARLWRTGKKAKADYINHRCDQISGKTVREALQDFNYEYNGKPRHYSMSDLVYDEKLGLLMIGDDSGKSIQVPNTTTKKRVAAKTVQKSASSSSNRRSRRSARPAPLVAFPAPVPAVPPPGMPAAPLAAGLQHVRTKVFGPLKKAAASGVAGEVAISTILGVGHQCSMDQTMLNALAEVLRKTPAERGKFGQMVLDYFESDLIKHK